jgi:hypothetical protein
LTLVRLAVIAQKVRVISFERKGGGRFLYRKGEKA